MVRKYKTTTVKPAAPKLTPSKENKIKVAIMNLKLTVGSQEMTFKSPLAWQRLSTLLWDVNRFSILIKLKTSSSHLLIAVVTSMKFPSLQKSALFKQLK